MTTHLAGRLLSGLIAIALMMNPARGLAQLPNESHLPGESAQHSKELPPESSLPPNHIAQTPSVFTESGLPGDRPTTVSEQTVQHDGVPPSTDDSATLPSEASLPPSSQAAQLLENAGEMEELLKLRKSEDGRPWLRILSKTPVDRIRSLSFSPDSNQLFVAGDDKEVRVYRRDNVGDFRYERTIRWQIQRGPVGRIYATSAAPGLLAFGGYGATGALGEISLVDPTTGQLLQTLMDLENGHRQRLTCLAFSPDKEGPTLASMDQNGRLLHWQQDRESGIWTSKVLTFDAANAEELQLDRVLHPVAMLDRDRVVGPVFHGRDPKTKQPRWRLRIHRASGGAPTAISKDDEDHFGLVSAMAASPNGQRLATADATGQLFLWNLSTGSHTKHRLAGIVSSLAFSSDGATLAIGSGYAGKRTVLLWNVSDPRVPVPLREEAVDSDVLSCDISPDGKYLAFSQGRNVYLRNIGRRITEDRLIRAAASVPTRVTFSKRSPYRISIEYPAKSTDTTEFGTNKRDTARPDRIVFDPQNGQIDNTPINASDWMTGERDGAGWTVVTNDDKTKAWLEQNGGRRGSLKLDARTDGMPNAFCWLRRNNRPWAVVVATSASNNLFVFQLAEREQCPLLRVFRGHTGSVTSISVSHDGRYLVSSGSAGIMRFWKLEGLDDGPLINRWGATFKEENNQVVVDSIRADGPLYFRGIRLGDTLTRLLHVDVVQGKERVSPVVELQPILTSLAKRDRALLTAFEYQRGRAPVVSFQSFPAWQPVASLFVNRQREWGFWTPAGFYDASFEGHRLFGWQVNRGTDLAPDFFLAAQVRRFLERPEIMARLLVAGDLEQAFKQAGVGAPGNWSSLLTQQHAMAPAVTILNPTPSSRVVKSSIEVDARVRTRIGQKLIPPKAFVNGVVGTNRRQLRSQQDGDFVDTVFRWNVNLPSDHDLLLQVVAATDDEVAGQASVRFQKKTENTTRRPRLFALTAGVNQYRDAQIPRLAYAVDNAIGVSETISQHAEPIYSTTTLSLSNESVSRATWDMSVEALARQLSKQVTPDDLLVVFLSGHGVRDETSDRYYYIAANTAYRDVQASRYEDCLSLDDLRQFAGIPCRKLVILDTCHSGAVNPMRQRELKHVIRALQDDLYLTLTATEGGQEAIESREKKLGRFTFRLLEGLRGAADAVVGNRDGIVALRELTDYVQLTVPTDAESNRTAQFPTAGPADLLELIDLPLTKPTRLLDTAYRPRSRER